MLQSRRQGDPASKPLLLEKQEKRSKRLLIKHDTGLSKSFATVNDRQEPSQLHHQKETHGNETVTSTQYYRS